MRWWASSVVEERCGRCGGRIPTGAALQRVSIAAVRRTRVRCVPCASEPVPDVVPPPAASVAPLTVLRKLGYLPLDEREPGHRRD